MSADRPNFNREAFRRIAMNPGNGHSRLADNAPDAPPIENHTFGELIRYYPASLRLQNGTGVNHGTANIFDIKRGPVKHQCETPIVPKPFLNPRTVAVAGGRTIGGGTSKETSRRQKRKSRS